MPPKKNVDVSLAPISATKTEELVADPLDDKELRSALGRDAKIVPYHDLSRYTNIDQLLPKKKDAAMLLYENRPMDGHWVCLTKNNGEISFFDPYGEVIDKQLQYSKHSAQRVQGEGDTSLHNLLATSKLPVFFNDYKYQRDGGGVNTCGRHCINFIRYNQKDGLDLEDYNEMMAKTQKETGLPYDELIAKMVPVHIPHPDDIPFNSGGARPLDPSLWNEVKAYTRTRFPKWSAYASGFASKIYKDRGGKWEDDGKGRPLKRWFKEVWKDVGGKEYPTYRPTKRISKATPLTASEISPTNLRKQTALKQRYKGERNLPPFQGGAKSVEEKKAYAREYYRRNREEISRKARAKRYGRPYEPPILYDSPFADEETMMEDKVGQSVLKMLNKKKGDEAKAKADAERAKEAEFVASIRRQREEEAEAEREREEVNRKQREYQNSRRDILNAQQKARYHAERAGLKKIVPKVPPKPNRPSQAKPKAPPRDWAKEIADRLRGLEGEGMSGGGSPYETYWWLK